MTSAAWWLQAEKYMEETIMANTARIFYQEDCNLSLLEGKTIAVIGYGSQGLPIKRISS